MTRKVADVIAGNERQRRAIVARLGVKREQVNIVTSPDDLKHSPDDRPLCVHESLWELPRAEELADEVQRRLNPIHGRFGRPLPGT